MVITLLTQPFSPILIRTVITLLLSLCIFQGAAAQSGSNTYAEAVLTSQNLIPGEQVNLEVRVSGLQPESRPASPEIEGVAVNYVRTITHIDAQRRLGFAFVYRLTPVKPGSYTVPPIEVPTATGALRTNTIAFTVHPLEKLLSLPSGVPNSDIKAAWFPAKTSLYQGEQCRVFLSLYVPNNIQIASWGYPDTTKVNCLAWRFTLNPEHRFSQVSLNNVTHKVVTYSTTLSGIQPGTATLGPSELTLYRRHTALDPRGSFVTKDTPIQLSLPAIEFEIKALPDGAPADFHGAVGDFEIDTYTEKTTFTQTDPTEVILRIAGTGNLPTINAPAFQDNRWKIIDTSKITRGEERRFITGMVTFRQLLRAAPDQELPKFIPEYSFSYFNPEREIYQTKTTAAIPVTILPTVAQAAAPSEDLSTRPEEMRNILGFIDRPATHHSKLKIQNSKLWHIIPVIICLLILFPLIRRKIQAARVQHPDTKRKNTALAKISENSDTRTFYRRAGRFIEQWLHTNPDLEKILHERDTLCFTQDTTQEDEITSERRSEIINLLKRYSKLTLILLLTLILTPNTFASDDSTERAKSAWKSGNYQEAINLYRAAYPEPANTPADTLFNIGNCHHRLQQEGYAALAWRQALAVDPTHKEAQQNLRFVEIENNALVPEYKSWQFYLLHLQPQIYQTIFYATLWLIGIIILILIVRKPRGLTLTALIALLVITPTLTTLARVAAHHYPDDHRFAPLEEQAVLLEKTKIYQEAHRQADHTTLPTASLVKINATRGPWTHITTTDDNSGWVESKKLGKIH